MANQTGDEMWNLPSLTAVLFHHGCYTWCIVEGDIYFAEQGAINVSILKCSSWAFLAAKYFSLFSSLAIQGFRFMKGRGEI